MLPSVPSPALPLNTNFAPNKPAQGPGLDTLLITTTLSITATLPIVEQRPLRRSRVPAAKLQHHRAGTRLGESHQPGTGGITEKSTKKSLKRLSRSMVTWPANTSC